MPTLEDLADEIHVSSVLEEDVELYCNACDETLMKIPAGEHIFRQTKGLCSCSWECCATAQPGNKPHPRHLAHRLPTE